MNKQGWGVKKLGDIATYINGYAFKPKDWEDQGLPIIRIQNLNSPTASYNYTTKQLDKKYIVYNGDILISWSASLGVYEWLGKKAILNQHIFKVVFNKIKINKIFFKYQIHKKIIEMLQHIHGATMKHITKKNFDNIVFLLPAISIQNQIVKELDTLQAIITKKKAQLVELDNLAQATFYEMFGDPVENKKGWDKQYLSELCNKITDGTHHSPQNSIEGDYPYITAKNIKKDGIDLSNLTYISQIDHEQIFSRCNPEKGDILYIKDGATTGIAQINTFDFQFSLLSSVALLKPNIKYITSYYLRDYLNNETIYQNIRDNMGGAAITRLTIKKIQSIKVLCPPLDLQNQFAKRIEAIEKQKALINQSISETQLLFDSAMDNYFN